MGAKLVYIIHADSHEAMTDAELHVVEDDGRPYSQGLTGSGTTSNKAVFDALRKLKTVVDVEYAGFEARLHIEERK